MDKLKATYKKYKEQINYVIFGVCTTAVNMIAYYLLMLVPWFSSAENAVKVFGGEYKIGYLVANAAAFCVAVIFSYWANRRFVFENKVAGAAAILRQFALFVATRLFSFAVEELLMFVSVEHMGIGEWIAKWPVAVVVVILNYVFGKLVVFRRGGK